LTLTLTLRPWPFDTRPHHHPDPDLGPHPEPYPLAQPKFFAALRRDYALPSNLRSSFNQTIAASKTGTAAASFYVFSAAAAKCGHSFHKHGASWLGQVHGRKAWWFLPPDAVIQTKPRVNPCLFMSGARPPPSGATFVMQQPGEIVLFPNQW
jgi:hypothetical protein